ncbi:unnamed protein product, partial [Thlaspi arvense]
MAGYDCLPMKMKRKEIDRVNDEFSDFSLSSPARKIRRLDLDLPPIMEEEVDLPPVMEEEEIQSAPANEERAIVLFKPLQHYSPQLFVDRSLISEFNNRFLHDAADDLYDEDDRRKKNQAVVPWNPSQLQLLGSWEPPKPEIVELDETWSQSLKIIHFLRDLGSELTTFQLHPSGHPINPDFLSYFLFLSKLKEATTTETWMNTELG